MTSAVSTSEEKSLIGTRFEVEVGAVAHGGFCVARHEGRAVFVRHTLPGERVVVEVTEGHDESRYLRADAVEVLVASPDRVESACLVSGPGGCGGCDWQHASLIGQRALKAAVVTEQLKRLAGIDREIEVQKVPGVPGQPEGLHWRTRVKFAVDAEGHAGLRRSRSHEVIALSTCPIAHPRVLEAGVLEVTWPGAASVSVAAPTGPRVETNESSVRVEYLQSTTKADEAEKAKTSRKRPGAGRKPVAPKTTGHQAMGPLTVVNDAAGRLWRSRVDGFWQVHPSAPDTLVAAVLRVLKPGVHDVVWDLYAGVGLFAGAIAPSVDAVMAVESEADACRDAERNLKDLPQVSVVHARVDQWLRPGARGNLDENPDLVVLDPPRKGAGDQIVRAIAAAAPRAVAYVACDPAALARDVALFAAQGYVLDSLEAFDLFPMTHHVECVAGFVPQA